MELENKRVRRNDFHTIRRRNFIEDDNFHLSTRRRFAHRATRNTKHWLYQRKKKKKKKKERKEKDIAKALTRASSIPRLETSQQIRI